MTKYLLTFFVFCAFLLPQQSAATVYYIDFSLARGGVGTATTTAFNSIDAFTEVARSPGDIAVFRRGAATTTGVSDVNFTSDGSVENPIIMTADYDNLWGEFATSSQTYSVDTATSTFYADAGITGISAGDWIYVEGDCFETYNSTALNQCEFAYQVLSISSATLTLYLPYKGNQSGTGLDLRVMPDAPQWNTTTGDFQWNFDTDDYWYIKGLDIRTTDNNGIEFDSSIAHEFFDCIIQGGSIDTGMTVQDDAFAVIIKKTRFFDHQRGFTANVLGDTWGYVEISDSLFDGNSESSSRGLQLASSRSIGAASAFVTDTIFQGYTTSNIDVPTTGSQIYLRNVRNVNGTAIESDVANNLSVGLFIEDDAQIKGFNKYQTFGPTINIKTPLTQSTTTAALLRSGGGPVSIQVWPSTSTTAVWDFNRVKLFEYAIYSDTSSKTYDVYLMSTSTSAWTTDPTNTELWIECDSWSHDTGKPLVRKVTKSTGVVDFNGSTAWQSLSVTCQPSQTGVLYLRGWYAKTKESGMNEFYVDGTPVIN